MGWRIVAAAGYLGAALGASLLAGCGSTSRNHPASQDSGGTTSVAEAGAGGAPIDVGNAGGGGVPESCQEEAALAKARVWRLTDTQYANAVRQLFGVAVGPEITELESNQVDFANFSEAKAKLVSEEAAARYQLAAEDIAAEAVESHYESFMPCGDDDACAEQFIRNRIARAFGHRLDDTELARYLELFRYGSLRSPQDGMRLLIEATLQSPSFLYRSELGPSRTGGPQGQVTLTPQELATLLALSLTNGLPDDELWQRADTGALADPAVLEIEVDRLLDLAETQDNLTDQASYWLGVRRLKVAEKDAALFPEYTAQLKSDLYESARLFLKDLIVSGSVKDVVSSQKIYLNESLAAVYGVPGTTGRNLRPVPVTAERAYGILSHPAVLAAWSRPNKNDVVHRGLFVFEALAFGGKVPSPPSNELEVEATFPPNATERELAALRAANPLCSGCHGVFDPLGLVSERYDAIGRYRATNASGNVDESAVLDGFGPELDGPLNGLADLSQRLLQGRRLSDSAAQHLASYTLGRPDIGDETSCDYQDLKEALAAGGKLRDFYKQLALSPAFGKRDAR